MVTPVDDAKHRARDEEILGWVRARASGEKCTAIGRRVGLTCGAISLATKDIKDADIAKSGEPEAVVAAAYWRGK
ncbi:MAG: hypothetical protein Q8K33_01670 [Cypionkella sp.]|uniref:hypothetical protein n=1 Tax=Cypionkella sp. TaxID=2811411 RepID=UPI00272F6D5D|nr:hypothetical protein [Cypionkella sp.]MDP2047590.1 hypothetical protein [Cypionkella sp.]